VYVCRFLAGFRIRPHPIPPIPEFDGCEFGSENWVAIHQLLIAAPLVPDWEGHADQRFRIVEICGAVPTGRRSAEPPAHSTPTPLHQGKGSPIVTQPGFFGTATAPRPGSSQLPLMK
jgi:hypothetical protein